MTKFHFSLIIAIIGYIVYWLIQRAMNFIYPFNIDGFGTYIFDLGVIVGIFSISYLILRKMSFRKE
ncbi:MAG: hypothetical protein P9L92_02970 [Candidatus Electryonea clarkiae]|nr:hypothetical protein [Candidatus Electryonea clarkiae]MDP8288334.1 hypothetical protein [Candidatus Electryonea clarkiae]